MRDALLATNSKILYSLYNWGADFVWAWESQVGNSWRVGDITNTWSSVASTAASNAGITSYATSGGFNNYDMIEISNGGLTAAERAHFGLWAICKSPLILGMDLTKISSSLLSIIKNKANTHPLTSDLLGLDPKSPRIGSNAKLYLLRQVFSKLRRS